MKPRITVTGTGAENYVGHALALYRQFEVSGRSRQTLQIDTALILFKPGDIKIINEGGGFICHPRTDDHSGGLTPDDKDITPSYVFPLVDDDHGSVTITSDFNTSTAFENYGNTVEQTQTEDAAVITWRGPSGKYLANASAVAIPGFLQIRKGTEDHLVPSYTPFAEQLYQDGAAIVPPTPGYVLCAATIAGVVWVVVQPLPSNGDQVLLHLVNNVWVEVARRPGYAEIPCIFQSDRIIFNNVDNSGEWTLTGEWTNYPKDAGTLIRGDGWNVTKNLEGTILAPGLTIAKTSVDVTGGNDSWVRVNGDIPSYSTVFSWADGGSIPAEYNPVGMTIGDWWYAADGKTRVQVTSVTSETVSDHAMCGYKQAGVWTSLSYVDAQTSWTNIIGADCALGYNSQVRGSYVGGCWRNVTLDDAGWRAGGSPGAGVTADCGFEVLSWYGSGYTNAGCTANSFRGPFFGGIYCYDGGLWRALIRTKTASVYNCTVQVCSC